MHWQKIYHSFLATVENSIALLKFVTQTQPYFI